MMKHDSLRSISQYRLRKLTRTKLFKALVILALPLYILSVFGQNKEIGLLVAVGMSAALLTPITFT